MSDKIVINIDVFRDKTAEEFTTELAKKDSKLETGSASAYVAALASALLLRAASAAAESDNCTERVSYIAHNAETLRKYMVHLIDEDVKCRGPLRKASLDKDPRAIEASRQSAVAICAEVLNMMCQCMDFLRELVELCPKTVLHYVGESAELALAAMKSARLYIVDMADKSSDETYRFVIRRENDIRLEQYREIYLTIISMVEEKI